MQFLFSKHKAPVWWPLGEWSAAAATKNKQNCQTVLAAMRKHYGVDAQ